MGTKIEMQKAPIGSFLLCLRHVGTLPRRHFGHRGQVTMAAVSMAAGFAVRLPLADAAEVVLLEEARDGLTLLLL